MLSIYYSIIESASLSNFKPNKKNIASFLVAAGANAFYIAKATKLAKLKEQEKSNKKINYFVFIDGTKVMLTEDDISFHKPTFPFSSKR